MHRISVILWLLNCAFVFLTNVKQLTLVNDHLLQLSLVWGPLQYFLVNAVSCDQAIHHHWFGLTNAVTAVLSLQVCLRVLREKEKTVSSNTVHLKQFWEICKELLVTVSVNVNKEVRAGLVFRLLWPALTQSLSKMITVSAAVRLIPSPPALVLNRNRNTWGSLENFVICKEKKQQWCNSKDNCQNRQRC